MRSWQTVETEELRRIQNAVALAEALQKEGFNVNVMICRDRMPCLHAYKKKEEK